MVNQVLTHPPISLAEQQALTERIDALESRNAFQDEVIEQLNQELAIHQEQLAELKLQLRLLAGRVKDLKGGGVADIEDETPPPHY